MRLFIFIVAVAITGCSGFPKWDTQSYVVARGETLYSIAKRYGLDYRELARWNQINAPYAIYPGQKLYLDPRIAYAYSPGSNNNVKQPKAAKPAASKTTTVNTSWPKPVAGQWQWPASGEVIQTFNMQTVNKGIDIAGAAGASVFASADGKVVYAGEGLKGYGRLIIVKHSDSFITAYAHNDELLVIEQQTVKQNEKIARMGRHKGQYVLHFEIRHNGQPVDPIKYLPKR